MTGGKGTRKTGVRGWSRGTNDSPDPGHVFADISVDGRVWGSTTGVNAPREDAVQGVVTHQWATRVTLARVLVSVQPRTNHVVGDYARVEDLTLLPAKESYPGAGQALAVLHSAGGCGPPACDLALLPWLGALEGQLHRMHVGRYHDRTPQLQQHEVMLI